MRKLLLKLLGVDEDYLAEIKKYNNEQQRIKEIKEFFYIEEKIRLLLQQSKDIMWSIRNFTESGLPITRYKQLSDKLRAVNNDTYAQLKKEYSA